jgi:hypothetical protein
MEIAVTNPLVGSMIIVEPGVARLWSRDARSWSNGRLECISVIGGGLDGPHHHFASVDTTRACN